MANFIQHMILPAAMGRSVILIEEVKNNETETSVSLVTADDGKPTLKATGDCVLNLYPFAKKIRIWCYGDYDLDLVCTFKLIDGQWFEQMPAYMRPRPRKSKAERLEALTSTILGSAKPSNT